MKGMAHSLEDICRNEEMDATEAAEQMLSSLVTEKSMESWDLLQEMAHERK